MNGRFIVGSILVLFGLLFLLENAGVWDFREVFHNYWPVLLVLWGIWLLVRRGTGRRERPVAGPDTGGKVGEQLNESSPFGDIVLHTESKQFRGGNVNGVFGNIRVEASDAVVMDGENVLNVNGVFGDVSLDLPKDTSVSVDASTVFGHLLIKGANKGGFAPSVAFESPGYGSAPRKLRVRVSAVFGKVEVRQ
jgi:lia operon protein LiaF